MVGVNLIEVVFDTTKTGLETVMRPWEAEALEYMWSRDGEIVSTREVWEHVYPLYGISRASINQFLMRMAFVGVLVNRPQSGKGGLHGRFTPRLDEAAFRREAVKKILDSLLDSFPEAGWEQIQVYRPR